MACTRHCALKSSGGGRHLSRVAEDVHICAPCPIWLLLELDGAVVRCPSFLFPLRGHTVGYVGCEMRPYPLFPSTVGTIFGVWHGHTRAHGLPIACPAATHVVRRQLQQHIVVMTRVWRNSAGTYDGHDFEHTVCAAVALAGDMGLSKEKVFLERTLPRRQFILPLFSCPAVHRQTPRHPRPSQGSDRPGS